MTEWGPCFAHIDLMVPRAPLRVSSEVGRIHQEQGVVPNVHTENICASLSEKGPIPDFIEIESRMPLTSPFAVLSDAHAVSRAPPTIRNEKQTLAPRKELGIEKDGESADFEKPRNHRKRKNKSKTPQHGGACKPERSHKFAPRAFARIQLTLHAR